MSIIYHLSICPCDWSHWWMTFSVSVKFLALVCAPGGKSFLNLLYFASLVLHLGVQVTARDNFSFTLSLFRSLSTLLYILWCDMTTFITAAVSWAVKCECRNPKNQDILTKDHTPRPLKAPPKNTRIFSFDISPARTRSESRRSHRNLRLKYYITSLQWQ